MNVGYEDVTVIVPTLNEAKNVTELLATLFNLYPKIKVVIADDGSTDDTQKIIKKMEGNNPSLSLIDRTDKPVHGLTASVLDAIGKIDTPFFVVLDGDLQHPPERIKVLVKKLREGRKIVVAVRTRVAVDWALKRRLMSIIAVKLGEQVLRFRDRPTCSDIMSGFFAADLEFVREAVRSNPGAFVEKGYKILFDLLKVLPPFTKIEEVPYTFGIRQMGKSKIGSKQIIAYVESLIK
ncbi:MAG: glycosyltransferase [Candidatus Altiarchaeota archaeon]